MDKITILLQDKQTIEKLAADPDVQLRIRDAILDGIGRRSMKLSGVASGIVSAAEREIRKEFFGDTWRDVLKDEYKDVIKRQVRKETHILVNEEIEECRIEISKTIRSWKLDVLKKLKEYDFEKDIREVAEAVIKEKFKN